MSFETLLPRFLRYVQIHTTSDHTSSNSPSTPGQWDLLRLLQTELLALGLSDVELTANGYVLATIPATTTIETPTIALLAHVDTSADFSGENVQPIVHRNYQGQVITLPNAPHRQLDPNNPLHSELKTVIGNDIVTSSGDTLLGADDKAGLAIIMALTEHLLQHPEIAHGNIRLCFTPDEEIGRGVDGVTLAQIGAVAAYTLDGEGLGEINHETFSADGAVVTIEGIATHPGTAQQYGMVNAVHLLGKLLMALPRENNCPEDTNGYTGFIHPLEVQGNAGQATLRLILRDHDNAKLATKGEQLRQICAMLQACHPTARVTCTITNQYRNMGYWLREQPLALDVLLQACQRTGISPHLKPVRGGTDGSRLTERGLPTPNIFTGGRNYHGPLEWVCVQEMHAAAAVLVELSQAWVGKSL
jgi:tripeptide aminopeptidase